MGDFWHFITVGIIFLIFYLLQIAREEQETRKRWEMMKKEEKPKPTAIPLWDEFHHQPDEKIE